MNVEKVKIKGGEDHWIVESAVPCDVHGSMLTLRHGHVLVQVPEREVEPIESWIQHNLSDPFGFRRCFGTAARLEADHFQPSELHTTHPKSMSATEWVTVMVTLSAVAWASGVLLAWARLVGNQELGKLFHSLRQAAEWFAASIQ